MHLGNDVINWVKLFSGFGVCCVMGLRRAMPENLVFLQVPGGGGEGGGGVAVSPVWSKLTGFA